MTVTGRGGCIGTVSKTFKVVPKAPGSLKAAKGASYKGSYRVYKISWGKVSGASGYQLKRTVKKSATSTVGSGVRSLSIAWPKGTTVKVQVRAYKVSSGSRYYSAWRTINVKVR